MLDKLDSSGRFDPFETVYEVSQWFHIDFKLDPFSQLVFQLIVRSISAPEIADDHALVSRLKALYDEVDSGTTPASTLLPWLPTPAMIRKMWATKKIYDIIVKVVRERVTSGKSGNDTLQMLLDSGDEEILVVGVSLFLTFFCFFFFGHIKA